jgi:squalene synthase HpnC
VITADREQLISAAWRKLPPSYLPPITAPSLAEAQAWCKQLALQHYENFHVASRFLPKQYRAHFYSIYAYCRVSDDLGDEVGDAEESLALLDYWQHELDECYRGRPLHPVFVALAETIGACNIPKQLFDDLLVAFRQDQRVSRYANLDEVLKYCRYSANPVGRLVLYLWGYRDEERGQLADSICTALQLANFWQDVREDYQRGRIYIPQNAMSAAGVSEQVIANGIATPQFRELLRGLVEDARRRFLTGKPLLQMVSKDLAIDLDLFVRGGLEILRAIEAQDYDVLRSRPAISKRRKAALLGRAVMARALGKKL